jgi:sulfate/thiosulfate transport system substrate-binding protein
MRSIWFTSAGASAAGLVTAAALLAGSAAARPVKNSVSLVAYSTPRDAYAKIISAFGQTAAGRGVSFTQSYGASGDQARAVAAGLPADVVALSLAPDVASLVKAGVVRSDWTRNRYHGIVSDSIVVFVVRDGNPKHIRTWGDLVKPGVEILTPNPFTSGGARWNIMAAYGAERALGKSHAKAVAYLRSLFRHVPVMDKSARESLQTFAAGKGDVLLTYENEAIYANRKGVRTDFVRPRQTILIQNPVALTKGGRRKPEARAFVKYLWSPAAQRAFAENGYRPVVKSVLRQVRFPKPKQLVTIAKLGGWKRVEKRFFDPKRGIVARLVGSVGR